MEEKTFIVAGIEPRAASIFAIEGMNRNQKESFGKKVSYLVVSYSPKKMDISDKVDDATLFTEDEAYAFQAALHNNSRLFDTFAVYDVEDLKSGLVTISAEPSIEKGSKF